LRVNQPPALAAQHGTPSFPTTGRLAEAVLWDYSFSFYLFGDTEFAVTYNEERTVTYSMMVVDAEGVGEIHVTASSGLLPLVTIPDTTAIPADRGYRYRTDDGSFLTADQLMLDVSTRTVVIPRLSIHDVQSAKASVQQVTFREPLLPSLAFEQGFLIGETEAPLREHLTTLLQTILGAGTFATQPLSLECHYGYSLGGLPVEAPVALMPRQDFAIATDAELIDEIAGSIAQWRDTIQPPVTEGRFSFKLKLWNAVPDQKAVLLQLGRVTLPISSVTD
jgi:hypothetical protein